jgi:N6-L-threonylcarbamoyladenine synthase
MKILAIETSCDETAVAIIEAMTVGGNTTFTVLGNALLSQIEIHREFGGVYPMVAKREHAKNIVPILEAALTEADMLTESTQSMAADVHEKITTLLEREPGLSEQFLAMITEVAIPDIDAIAVTAGPGLEPALWVGVNFAKALSLAWNKPLVPVNHMEGHIMTALMAEPASEGVYEMPTPELPLVSLLISGGHTEIVLSKEWLAYKKIGETKDDAVGEAFDKVARMLGLQYPGGPEVSKLAEKARERGGENPVVLPRPMIHEHNLDFSFSGLKTAVLYKVRGKELTDTEKEDLARAFEEAAADVLYAKTARALEETNAASLALGGGVSANTHITRTFRERVTKNFPHVRLCIPSPALTGDNALMIAFAGYFYATKKQFADPETLRANGNLQLS